MRSILILIAFSAVILRSSMFSLEVGADENNLFLTSSACITDDTEDWMGGIGLDCMDITSACVVNIDYWTVCFEITVASDIPNDPSPKFIGYVWELDFDQNGIFNEFPPYAPVYTDLNVRVSFDPSWGWEGYIDGKPGPPTVFWSFSIEANTVSFTLPLSLIYNPTSFHWQALTVGSSEGTNLPRDIAPNHGLPRASWTRQPYGPEAEFEALPDAASPMESIKFNASASLSGSNGTHEIPITEYCWNFGDGNETTTSTPIVYHKFDSSGLYNVTLTVYAFGATPETDSIAKIVTITATPVGGCSYQIEECPTMTRLPFCFALIVALTGSYTMITRKCRRIK